MRVMDLINAGITRHRVLRHESLGDRRDGQCGMNCQHFESAIATYGVYRHDMKPSLALKLVGGLLIVMGLVLRLTVDGNLVQIPTVMLVFGGLGVFAFGIKRSSRN